MSSSRRIASVSLGALFAVAGCGGAVGGQPPTIIGAMPGFGAVTHAHGDSWSFYVSASDGSGPERLFGQLFAKSSTRQALISTTTLAILGANEYQGGFAGSFCSLLDNFYSGTGVEIDVYVSDEDLGATFDPTHAPDATKGHYDTRAWTLTCQ